MVQDTFALDIETIPLVDDPTFDDPAHWTVFAVALGHSPEQGERSVTVLFRDDHTLTSEGELINDAITWIADRTSTSTRKFLTYNGVNYDIPILKHRSARVEDVEPGVSICERLSLLLDMSDHVDLIQVMRNQTDEWVSLDDALEEHGIATDEPTWMGTTVSGSDMPRMGLELLTDRENADLREVVRRYAESDVAPLFELHEIHSAADTSSSNGN